MTYRLSTSHTDEKFNDKSCVTFGISKFMEESSVLA